MRGRGMIRRRLFNFAAAGSLSLLLATVGLWVRSYWRYDDLERLWHDAPNLHTDMFYAYSNCGLLVFSYGRFSYATQVQLADDVAFMWPQGTSESIRISSYPADRGYNLGLAGNRWWNWIGFRITQANQPLHIVDNPSNAVDWNTRRWVNVPNWAFTGVFAALPACWFISYPRRGSKKAGVCSRCSYNLTGNASGVCPECGTPVQRKPEAVA